MKVKGFTFNELAENTYVCYDETGECVIVDPGCNHPEEEAALADFIIAEKLRPVRLLNTHCHFDHVFGNKFVFDKWGLKPEFHRQETPIFKWIPEAGARYGFDVPSSPEPETYVSEDEPVTFGNTTLEVLFTPGHSPGEVCFYHAPSKQLIAGDVLFQGSIGRTDLPGGSFETLMESIFQKIVPLGPDVVVYCGHGDSTTVGAEVKSNPFLTN